MKTRKLKRVVIKEEFVSLTGCHIQALILNQLLYWQDRVKDFDKFIKEEKERNPETQINLTHGWIYKKSSELSDELMIGKSDTTVRRSLKELVDSGIVSERENQSNRWDKTKQYRVNLRALDSALKDIGHSLEGYCFEDLQNEESREQNESSRVQNIDSSPGFEGTYIRNTEITTETKTKKKEEFKTDSSTHRFDEKWGSRFHPDTAKRNPGFIEFMTPKTYVGDRAPTKGDVIEKIQKLARWEKDVLEAHWNDYQRTLSPEFTDEDFEKVKMRIRNNLPLNDDQTKLARSRGIYPQDVNSIPKSA